MANLSQQSAATGGAPWLYKLREGWSRVNPAWMTALLLYVPLRLFSSAWMWLVSRVFVLDLSPHPVLRPYLDVAPEPNAWLSVWQRWDVLHYQALAERGFAAYDTALFTPPLYPALMRLGSHLTGGSTLLAGILVSNLCFFLLMVYWYKLACLVTADRGIARRSVVYLTFFPSAFFFLAAYSEALFVLAVVLHLLALRQKQWGLAWLWASVSILTRWNGLVLLLPMAYASFRDWRQNRRMEGWISLGGVLLVAAVFPGYIWWTLGKSPLTPLFIQNARAQATFTWPGINMAFEAIKLANGAGSGVDWLELALLLLFTLGAVAVWRTLPREMSVYYLGMLAIYLTRTSAIDPLLSVNRFMLTLFPLFIVLASWGANRWVHRLVLYSSWAGFLYLTGQFAIWGWVG